MMISKRVFVFFSALTLLLFTSCNTPTASQEESSSLSGKSQTAPKARALPDSFNNYWYNGEAEISVYELSQARYGELREGHASMIFVTEPFNPKKLVKSNQASEQDVSVLKLNFTRKFNTGIYPYSTMVSSFVPVQQQGHALKVSTSVQEWCGQIYSELRNPGGGDYEVDLYSYFEDETQTGVALPKNTLENELWNLVKLSPENLPEGDLKVVPSFLYLRLMHKPMQAYPAEAQKSSRGDTITYQLHYPDLKRTLEIHFDAHFPHQIWSWKDSHPSGFGDAKKILTTTATLKSTYKGAYWSQNSNADSTLRRLLQLHKL